MSDYREIAKKHYADFFKKSSSSSLVKYEDQLSKMIDSDFMCETFLFDMVIVLYELVRDECVRRVSFMSSYLS